MKSTYINKVHSTKIVEKLATYLVFRFLEELLNNKYTGKKIIDGLKDMNFYKIRGEEFIPAYIKNDFTDDRHDAFGFKTDFQIMANRQLKKI